MSERYFSHPSLNASTLKLFAGGDDSFSPYTAVSNMRREGVSKDCFRIGHGLHSGLEHMGVLPDKYIESPYDSFRSKESKSWRVEQEKLGHEVFSQKDYQLLKDMIESVWEKCPSDLKEMIQSESSKREIEIYEGEFKSMMDLITNDGVVVDYKTTRHSSPSKIQYEAIKLGYHIQAYHYSMVYELWTGEPPKDFIFLFVCKPFPNEVIPMRATQSFLDQGERDWQIAYDRYNEFKDMAIDELPRFSDTIHDLESTEIEDVELDFDDEEELQGE